MIEIPDVVRSPLDTVDLAYRLVREGRSFSAHEVLESRWKHCPAEERDLWKGLAQLCVAVTHAARGNGVGAARLLERARVLLARYRGGGGMTYGVDLSRAYDWARDRVAAESGASLPRLPAAPLGPGVEPRVPSDPSGI